MPPKVLAATRFLMCILCTVIIGFDASGSISSGQSFGRWLSFLTSWTWVLCLFVLFPALAISLYYIKVAPPATSSCNAWMRLHWIMWEMAGWTPPPLLFHVLAHLLFLFSRRLIDSTRFVQPVFPWQSPFYTGRWCISRATP